MKRWMLVLSPAAVIAVLGAAFVLLTDRDPVPLAPSAALASPSALPAAPTEAATGPEGPTTPTEPGEASEPTGPTASKAESDEETSRPDEEGEGSGSGVVVPPPPDPGTVTLEVTATASPADPLVFSVPVGATVLLEVTSTNVTDRVVVGDGAISVKVAPGAHKTLEFSVDEPGEVRVALEGANAVLATIAVGA